MDLFDSIDTKKRCGHCKQSVPRSEIKSNGWCAACRREYDREWARTNKDKLRAKRQRSKQRPGPRALALWHRARKRSRHAGLPFNLTVEWIAERLRTGRCEVTGLPFDLASPDRGPWSPSLDRLERNGPYAPENVRVVVWIYNLSKNKFGHADVLLMAKALVGER
jgi:hypothetical protein